MKYLTLVVLLLVVPSVYAQPLMRLFYTPAERAQIDQQRTAKNNPNTRQYDENTASIELKGYLKRQDGEDVIWVNDKNTLNSNKPMSDLNVISIQSGGKVKMRLRGQGVLKLKPGEVFTRSSQHTREVYEQNAETNKD